VSAAHRWSGDQSERNHSAGPHVVIVGTAVLVAAVVVIAQPGKITPAAAPAAVTPEFAADDWPWWRGPQRNGESAPEQSPPLNWSETENVLWKVPVPGRGHGSPCLVGDRIYLATAEEEPEQIQSVLCLDRQTGEKCWSTVVHRGKFVSGGNKKSTHASTTPACDGERVYITFLNDGAIFCSALSLDGDLLWQQRVDDFVIHQGYGASPTVYGGLVLVSADHKGGGAVAGLDRITGAIAWKQERPATANYTSPIIVEAAGREQLVYTGCNLVASYDPLTGDPLWKMDGSTTECVTSTVTDGQLVFSTGGYPQNHVQAVVADGSGKVAWEKKVRVYVPSLLMREGNLYLVTDDGVAACWRASDGDELWKGRIGGTFSSSPVLVGDRIYATDESGVTSVFKATPDGFEEPVQSRLANEVFATPVIAGSRIYYRAAVVEGDQRQEWLYCLGK
jgi:outer membrane protein assembly factor BamB